MFQNAVTEYQFLNLVNMRAFFLIPGIIATCSDQIDEEHAIGSLFLDPTDSCKGCECQVDNSTLCRDICDKTSSCVDIRFDSDFDWSEVDDINWSNSLKRVPLLRFRPTFGIFGTCWHLIKTN